MSNKNLKLLHHNKTSIIQKYITKFMNKSNVINVNIFSKIEFKMLEKNVFTNIFIKPIMGA